ncbi:MAG: hypothetical protein ACK53Z_00235 [Betaproteobacteria bacterium]|jgi:hypothetical protein
MTTEFPSAGDATRRDGSALSEGLGPRVPERESDEERYLYERLADLRRTYELAAKPYIERLVQIRSLRPAPSIKLTPDQARELIDFTMGLTTR